MIRRVLMPAMADHKPSRRPLWLPSLLLVLFAVAANSPLVEQLEPHLTKWLIGHRFEVATGAATLALVLWLEVFQG